MKMRNDPRLAREMKKAGLDLVLAFSMENVLYLSGALFALQDNIRDRLSCAGFAADGTDFLLCATNESSSVEDQTHIERKFAYVEFQETPIACLARGLRELGLEGARIGVEMRYLGAAYYQELVEALPGASFAPCDHVLEVARAVKLPDHIRGIEAASRATERAVLSGFSASRPGDTEQALAHRIIAAMYAEGAQTIRHAVVTVGHNATKAHPFPSPETLLNPGDAIRVDVGGLFQSIGTDIARMAVVGEPSPAQRKLYETLRDCVREVGAGLRAGITAGDVYENARAFYGRAGIDFKRDHVGHSLSVLGSHDEPLLYPGNPMPLEENMVIALEPILRDDQGRRYTVEDVFVVETGGGRLLTAETSTDDMFVIR